MLLLVVINDLNVRTVTINIQPKSSISLRLALRDRGKPLWMKLKAILLYCNGMSLNAIGKHLNVSAQSILNWVRNLVTDKYEKPEPGEAIVVELLKLS